MADVTGSIFEIREFCVHDGPGVRTTVFFKGCPMRCLWCHNPEGWKSEPEPMPSKRQPDRICGVRMAAHSAAARILLDRQILMRSGGGVTFSGGEPLSQIEFLLALAQELKPLHLAIETSGYAPEADFRRMLAAMDLVYQDFKSADDALHRKFTGCSNAPILNNLRILQESGKPYVIRMPLVPGYNDGTENLRLAAGILAENASHLQMIELLPYQSAGKSKYSSLGLEYQLPVLAGKVINPEALAIFRAAGLPVSWPYGCEVI